MRKIQFFLVFVLVLAACTSPESQATVITPTPIPTVGVDLKPVGFGLTPDLASSINQFTPPLKEDFTNYSHAEAEIPESIKSEVELYKTEMAKHIAEVADICAVNANSLKPVFKSNDLAGEDYRWTVVYESSADNATCWSSVLSTGTMGEYPTYFYEEDGAIKVFSKAKGGGWERMDDAMMDFAGIQPVALFENGYLQPQGHTLGEMYGYILDYGEVPEFVIPMDSPFSADDMTVITNAGWHWEKSTASLNDPDNNEVLHYLGNHLRDSQGNKMEVSDVKFLEVNGVDDKGVPVKLILERTVNDEQGQHTEIYVQKTSEWRSMVGYEPGTISNSDGTPITDVMTWNPVTEEDVASGFLRELVLSQQYKWPENVTIPDYYLAFVGGSRTGALELTIFGLDRRLAGEYADRYSNGTGTTPILEPQMYRIQSPNNSDLWLPLGLAMQKGPNGEDLVFAGAYGSLYITSGEGGRTSLQFVGPGLRTTYLLGMDGYTCEGASLRGGIKYQTSLISDSCAAFMPPNDKLWGRFTWETILNGADFGTKWESDPIDINKLAGLEDDVLVAYNW